MGLWLDCSIISLFGHVKNTPSLKAATVKKLAEVSTRMLVSSKHKINIERPIGRCHRPNSGYACEPACVVVDIVDFAIQIERMPQVHLFGGTWSGQFTFSRGVRGLWVASGIRGRGGVWEVPVRVGYP